MISAIISSKMIRLARIVILIFLLYPFELALCLNRNTPLTQAVLENWSTDQGAPAGRIHRILQDADGYLWLASDGLARFDGLRFAVFDSQNTPAFASDVVLDILLDHEGVLWIALYKGGIVQYKNGKFSLVSSSVKSLNTSMFEAEDHRVWIGSEGPLRYYENGKVINFKDSNGTELKSVDDISQTRDGALWFWSAGDVWMLKDNKLAKQAGPDFKSESTIEHTFFRDRSGKVWFSGTESLGYIEGEKVVPFKSNKELGDRVISLITDEQGAIWLGLRNQGLIRCQNGKLERFGIGDGLTSNQVFSLAEDREGSIWIGTNGSGLNRLRDGKVITFSTKQGMSSKYIQAVLEDSTGNLWFGTEEKGAIRLSNGQFTTFSTAEGMPGNTVYAIGQDSSGSVWFGTAEMGAGRLENGKIKAFTTKDGLRDNVVLSFWLDRDRLLIGGISGLSEYRNGKLTPVGPAVPKPIPVIYGTRNGDIWFGSLGRALIRWSNGKFANYGHKEGLTDTNVLALHEDAEGNLWMATYSGGLFRFRDGKFTNYTRKEGLYQNILYAILEDDHNRLWISSNKGIFAVSKRELNDMADGKIQSLHCMVIGKEDGMRTAECNNGAAWKTKDGKLWFGTPDGAVMLDPDHIPFNRLEPQVVLEVATADTHPIGNSLPAGTKKLEFHFVALSLLSAAKNQYQYMLEGFDSDWSHPSNSHAAYYSNLPPGSYVFHVKGSNNDGIWNEKGATLGFRIAPYFYQTWSFYILCAGAVLLVFYLIYYLRVRQVRSRFRAILDERGRISREIHDTITQDLSGIILQLEAAELQVSRDLPAGMHSVARAKDLARKGLGEARRLIGGLRPRVLETDRLAPALSRMVQGMRTESTDIQFHLTGKERTLDRNTEDQLLRISQEALTNALKHSKATVIHVHLEFSRSGVILKVQDNGTGFDAQAPVSGAGGFGLPGMKDRAASIGGQFSVLSGSGQGTTILVEISK